MSQLNPFAIGRPNGGSRRVSPIGPNPAKVSCPNRHRPFGSGRGNGSSSPVAAVLPCRQLVQGALILHRRPCRAAPLPVAPSARGDRGPRNAARSRRRDPAPCSLRARATKRCSLARNRWWSYSPPSKSTAMCELAHTSSGFGRLLVRPLRPEAAPTAVG